MTQWRLPFKVDYTEEAFHKGDLVFPSVGQPDTQIEVPVFHFMQEPLRNQNPSLCTLIRPCSPCASILNSCKVLH